MNKIGCGVWLWVLVLGLVYGTTETLIIFIGIPLAALLIVVVSHLCAIVSDELYRQRESAKQLRIRKIKEKRAARKIQEEGCRQEPNE